MDEIRYSLQNDLFPLPSRKIIQRDSRKRNFSKKEGNATVTEKYIYNGAIRCGEVKEVRRRAPDDSQTLGGKKMRKICKECFKDQHPAVKGMCPVELIPASEVKICPIWSIKERREYNARKTVQ